MTIIIDYGVGNIFNVLNAFSKAGIQAKLSANPDEILGATHIVLPGVGAFEDAIKALTESGLSEVLNQARKKQIPILGICLGMQLLYEMSLENGAFKGLGYLQGTVKSLSSDLVSTIPHMGWNELVHTNISPFKQVEGYVYFVHSFIAPEDDHVVYAYVDYEGCKIPAIVGCDNIYGMQFHPEKSSSVGADLIQAFFKLTSQGDQK